jgi:putative peptide zinc metalloprotease protein
MAEGTLKLDQLANGMLRQSQAPQQQLEVPEQPALGDDVELLGQMKESAFLDPQWLISRDGRYVQVTELLYRIAEQINGQRNWQQIAEASSPNYERAITPDEVRDLIASSLIPSGLVKLPNGTTAPQATDGPSPLQINLKMKMLPPGVIDGVTSVLKWLYYPPILITALIATAIAQYWVFFVHGLGAGLYESMNTPGMLAALLGVILLSAIFHEFGHASGLTYGGGKVGAMGAGLYIVYPALYTDVTDNYRLGRWARIRTDLGGFYFNLIFSIGLTGAYFLTGQEFLLVGVAAVDIEIVHQVLPFIRMDGYWALADLTGIPDFFSSIGAYLRSVLPGWVPLPKGRELPPLKPWAKLFFAAYILLVIPLLIGLFFLLFRALPRIIATGAEAFWDQATGLPGTFGDGDYLLGLATILQIVLLLLPSIGAVLIFAKLALKFVKNVWKWGAASLPKRMLSITAIGGAAALLLLMWAPQVDISRLATGESPALASGSTRYKPLQPGERLNVGDAFRQQVVIAQPQPSALPVNSAEQKPDQPVQTPNSQQQSGQQQQGGGSAPNQRDSTRQNVPGGTSGGGPGSNNPGIQATPPGNSSGGTPAATPRPTQQPGTRPTTVPATVGPAATPVPIRTPVAQPTAPGSTTGPITMP